MEHVHQMRAACGLASALMVLRPGLDRDVKALLDASAEMLDRTLPSLKSSLDRPGVRYQLAAANLVLVAARSDAVQDALAAHDVSAYEDILAVILYEMHPRLCGKRASAGPMVDMLDRYAESGHIPAKLLESYTTVVKSNLEIKLLMGLFGHAQVVFPGSEDGTGALPLSLMSGGRGYGASHLPPRVSAAERFLVEHFEACEVMVLKDAHWSAIKAMGIEDGRVKALVFLDPGVARGREFRIDPWDPRARLYFFRKDKALRETMVDIVVGLLTRQGRSSEGSTSSDRKDVERG